MTTFDELGVSKKVCDAIMGMGWVEPTPIQVQAVPEGLAGRDMFAQAQTGTGKTGVYSMIVLGRIRRGSDIPLAIVMTPTRELADQVSKEMIKLARFTRHKVCAVYGGASISEQIQRLSEGCDIVVGTPGRIIDLHGRGILKLDAVRELVIDEADRMLDMGFIDDMNDIISMLPEERQTMMFSATISDEIRGIMEMSMREPIEISVSQDDIVSDLVTQYYIVVNRNGKREVLKDILSNGNPKTVIFCSTKKMVDDLSSILNEEGIKAGCIHGDLSQLKREKTIRNFKFGRMNILIATDVAARGLDIDDIECVVNYDSPTDPETYTHRIGRAGRAGRTGVAITFITPREDRRIEIYEEYMGREIERISKKHIPKLEISNPELKELHADDRARREEEYNKRKKRDNRFKNDASSDSGMSLSAQSIVISLDIGRSSDVDRTDILRFITTCSGVEESSIGRIGMKDETAFVEVDPSTVDSIMDAINRSTMKGMKVHATVAPRKKKYKERSEQRNRHRDYREKPDDRDNHKGRNQQNGPKDRSGRREGGKTYGKRSGKARDDDNRNGPRHNRRSLQKRDRR